MNLGDMLFELIDLRSFSSLWYWIALAVVWSGASHAVLGVPFDMVLRARREGGAAEAELAELVRINTARLARIARQGGAVLLGVGSAMISMLAVLGFVYRVEFCQALLLLLLPLSALLLMTFRAAGALDLAPLTGAALCQRLARHRLRTQMLGVASIFVTAMWGMWQNLQLAGFG